VSPVQEQQAIEVFPASEDFARLTDPFRRELLALCYRMLGSVDDAEDAVQETYLRAWLSYDKFEGRSSLRTWMYRIATRVCLKALERGVRRPLPSGLGGPSDAPNGPVDAQLPEAAWLQPIPDALFGTDPARIVESRQSIRLAFIAALQHLPPRQRAVLIFRDVLAWQANEIAELLETTTAAVNSALQRARAQIAQIAPAEDHLTEPTDPRRRALLDGYAAAFENADITALTKLLRDDAVWEMPPFPTWFSGRETVGRFLATRLQIASDNRLIATAANGQPAFGVYTRGHDGAHHPHAVQVLTVTASGIANIVSFQNPRLFATFGLPPALPASAPTVSTFVIPGGEDSRAASSSCTE
jgi:RNA polymerase sigma-70 factor (ECF subfamily)